MATAPRAGAPYQERAKLLEALAAHGGNRVRTAQHLGISRAGLYRLLDEHGLA